MGCTQAQEDECLRVWLGKSYILSLLYSPNAANASVTPHRGRDLWAKLKTAVKQVNMRIVLHLHTTPLKTLVAMYYCSLHQCQKFHKFLLFPTNSSVGIESATNLDSPWQWTFRSETWPQVMTTVIRIVVVDVIMTYIKNQISCTDFNPA